MVGVFQFNDTEEQKYVSYTLPGKVQVGHDILVLYNTLDKLILAFLLKHIQRIQ